MGRGQAMGTPSSWRHSWGLEGVLTLMEPESKPGASPLTSSRVPSCTRLLSILLFCHEALTKDQADANSGPWDF